MADYKERLGQFLRSVDSAASGDSINYIIDGSGTSDGDDLVRQGDDLNDVKLGATSVPLLDSPEALLGSYAAFWQKQNDMHFRVAPGSFYSETSNRGDPLPSAENQGVDYTAVTNRPGEDPVPGQPRTFVTTTNPSLKIGATLSQYSNSGKFDSANRDSGGLAQIIDKLGYPGSTGNIELSDGTIVPNGPSGDYLLASVEGRNMNRTGQTLVSTDPSLLGDRKMPQSAINILKNDNPYRPAPGNTVHGRAFANTDEDLTKDNFDKEGNITNQRSYGEFLKDGSPGSNPVTQPGATGFEALKNIGISLLINSAGYDYPADPGVEGASFRSSIIDSAVNNDQGAFPEGHADDTVGVKIDPKDLRARSVPSNPFKGVQSSGDYIKPGEITNDDKSYGSMNTPETPFSGARSAGLINAQAAAAILLMSKAVERFKNSMVSSTKANHAILGRGPFFKGENSTIKLARSRLLRNLLFVPTNMPYNQCVVFGLKIIFGDSPTDFAKVKDYVNISDSAGYYLVIARSIIRASHMLEQAFIDTSDVDYSKDTISMLLETIGRSKILGFLNVVATIGNIAFTRSAGKDDVEAAVNGKGPFAQDHLPNTPATRIMKSRDGSGYTTMSLAWRGSSLPAIYMLPTNVIRTQTRMGTNVQGTSPTRGMLMSSLNTKTYIDMSMEGSNARIPGEIIERMENLLDSEYVPFYFHDLRTNEIVSFHAFLGSLTDRYTVLHTETGGYGRVDPVQTYSGTKRSLDFSFFVVATSQEDFDEMWFKINKLVTLAYPQWTKGTTVEGEEGQFVQPFSQILGSSPIMRLRIGDVIKSNYSKFHLARIFGLDMEETDVRPFLDKPDITGLSGAARATYEKIFMTVFQAAVGSPLQWMTGIPGVGGRMLRGAVSQILLNGFANPLTLLFTKSMRDPDTIYNPAPVAMNLASAGEAAIGGLFDKNFVSGDLYGYHKAAIVFLKPTDARPYVDADGNRWRFDRPVRGMVMGRETQTTEPMGLASNSRLTSKSANFGNASRKTFYTISLLDFTIPLDLFGKNFTVTHSDLISDPNNLFSQMFLPLLDPLGTVKGAVQFLINEAALALGVPTDTVQIFATDDARFMSPQTNAIVQSFHASRGRGLAGVFTNLSFDWIDGDSFTWETDWNSRAPKVARVTVGFTPIHDIPPGLAHDGFNRAPIYNVGRVMDSVAGDVYDDNGMASRFAFGNANRGTFRKVGKDDGFKPE